MRSLRCHIFFAIWIGLILEKIKANECNFQYYKSEDIWCTIKNFNETHTTYFLPFAIQKTDTPQIFKGEEIVPHKDYEFTNWNLVLNNKVSGSLDFKFANGFVKHLRLCPKCFWDNFNQHENNYIERYVSGRKINDSVHWTYFLPFSINEHCKYTISYPNKTILKEANVEPPERKLDSKELPYNFRIKLRNNVNGWLFFSFSDGTEKKIYIYQKLDRIQTQKMDIHTSLQSGTRINEVIKIRNGSHDTFGHCIELKCLEKNSKVVSLEVKNGLKASEVNCNTLEIEVNVDETKLQKMSQHQLKYVKIVNNFD